MKQLRKAKVMRLKRRAKRLRKGSTDTKSVLLGVAFGWILKDIVGRPKET